MDDHEYLWPIKTLPLLLPGHPAYGAQTSVSKEKRAGGWFECQVDCDVSYLYDHLRHNPTFSLGISHCGNDEDESFVVLAHQNFWPKLSSLTKSCSYFWHNLSSNPQTFLIPFHFHPCLPWFLSEPPVHAQSPVTEIASYLFFFFLFVCFFRELGQELLLHPILACPFIVRAYWLGLDSRPWMSSKPDGRGERKGACPKASRDRHLSVGQQRGQPDWGKRD